MIFQYYLNQHLTVPIAEPIFVDVKQIRGYATSIDIPVSLLPIIKNPQELHDSIQLAAMNNFKSLTDDY